MKSSLCLVGGSLPQADTVPCEREGSNRPRVSWPCGFVFLFPTTGMKFSWATGVLFLAGCARSIRVEHKVSLPARALSTHTWSTQTSWIVDLFTQADTEMGILSRPKLSLYPSHLTFYWALFELDCVLLTLDHGSDVSSGLPSILATLSTPSLAWEHRFCCAQPACLHLLRAETSYPGALQWSQHSQTLLFSAVSSFPVRLAMLTLESLVAVLLLQPFCPGPSHSSISAGLILNIDYGLWVCSHIPLLCLASSQDPGQGQIPGDPLPRKERWAHAVQFCCFSWFELSCCPRWSHPESSPYSTEFHRLIHSNEKNLATKFIGIEKLGVIWSNAKSGAPDVTSALWYPALLTPGSTQLTSLLVQKPTSFPRPKMLCAKTCRRLSTIQALLSGLIFV